MNLILINSKLTVAIFFMIALFSSVIVFGFDDDAFALKSKGTYSTKYGDATKNIVCGDKLCSDVKKKDDNDRSSAPVSSHPEKTENSTTDDLNTLESKDKIHQEHYNTISDLQAKIKSLEEKIARYEMETETVAANIERFDHLDFVSFNKQDWGVFSDLHHPDVLVGYSDGRETIGMDAHRPDVEFSFVYAPDIKITGHPITFGQGEWTAGTGVIEGTFTEPMPLPDGTVIEPTGNSFKYTMVTIAKWQDGVITEEYLFWDNAEVARQLGMATP